MGGVPKEIVIDNLKAFVQTPRSSTNNQAIRIDSLNNFVRFIILHQNHVCHIDHKQKGKQKHKIK